MMRRTIVQWNYHLRKQNANTSLAGLGISPLTVSSKSKSQKVHVCQDKLQRATRKLAGELTLAAKVESNSICNETKFSDLKIKLWKSNSDKLKKLMAQLKIKYDASNYSDKIQILTVVSKIWTQKEIIGFF